MKSRLDPDAAGSASIPGRAADRSISPAAIHDPLQMEPLLLDATYEKPEWRRADDHGMNDKNGAVPRAPIA